MHPTSLSACLCAPGGRLYHPGSLAAAFWLSSAKEWAQQEIRRQEERETEMFLPCSFPVSAPHLWQELRPSVTTDPDQWPLAHGPSSHCNPVTPFPPLVPSARGNGSLSGLWHLLLVPLTFPQSSPFTGISLFEPFGLSSVSCWHSHSSNHNNKPAITTQEQLY